MKRLLLTIALLCLPATVFADEKTRTEKAYAALEFPGTVEQITPGRINSLWITLGPLTVAPSQVLIADTSYAFGWSDALWQRQGAGYLFQRNSTNAQRLGIANTYTGTTNFESFDVDWQTTANSVIVGSRTAATGTGRPMVLVSQASSGGNSYIGIRLERTNAPFIKIGGTLADSAFSVQDTAGTDWVQFTGIRSTATSGSIVPVAILPAYNQASGNAANTDLSIARTETALGSGAQYFINMLGGAAGTTQRAAIDNTGKVAVYGSVATAGQGVEVIRAQATTGTVNNSGTASIATWTPGAADVEVEVSCRVNITTSTTHSFSCDVTYTDVSNAARTRVLPMFPISGTQLTSSLMTNTVGVGDFASATIRIGVKASTAIVVRTSSGGTFTTVTYTASGTIKQVG